MVGREGLFVNSAHAVKKFWKNRDLFPFLRSRIVWHSRWAYPSGPTPSLLHSLREGKYISSPSLWTAAGESAPFCAKIIALFVYTGAYCSLLRRYRFSWHTEAIWFATKDIGTAARTNLYYRPSAVSLYLLPAFYTVLQTSALHTQDPTSVWLTQYYVAHPRLCYLRKTNILHMPYVTS